MQSHRFRILALATSLVAIAGCTSEVEPSIGVNGDSANLVFAFEDGQVLTYDVDLTQHLLLAVEGQGAGEAGSSELPEQADVTIEADGVFTFTVSAGPDEGTHTIAIEGEFGDVAVSGTADGQPVDESDDLAELGVLEPVSTVVVVDDHGNQVGTEGSQTADPFGLAASPLSGLAGDLNRFVGPILPSGPQEVGDSWTSSFEDSSLSDEPVETTVTGTLTSIDGDEATIDSELESGEGVLDLSEMFGGFMGAFADPNDPETQASIQEMVDQLVFRIVVAPSSSRSTARFDVARGVTVSSDNTGTSSLAMEVNLPDEESGDIQSFTMNLDVEQTMSYLLADDGS